MQHLFERDAVGPSIRDQDEAFQRHEMGELRQRVSALQARLGPSS